MIFFKVSKDLIPERTVLFKRVMLLYCRFICSLFKTPNCRKVKLRHFKYYQVSLALLLLCLIYFQFSLNSPFFILWGTIVLFFSFLLCSFSSFQLKVIFHFVFIFMIQFPPTLGNFPSILSLILSTVFTMPSLFSHMATRTDFFNLFRNPVFLWEKTGFLVVPKIELFLESIYRRAR